MVMMTLIYFDGCNLMMLFWTIRHRKLHTEVQSYRISSTKSRYLTYLPTGPLVQYMDVLVWLYLQIHTSNAKHWFNLYISYMLSCLRSCVRDRVSCDRCRAFPLVEMEFRQCVCFPSENAFDKFDDNTDHPWQDAFSELGKNASGQLPPFKKHLKWRNIWNAFFEPRKTHLGSSHPSRSIWNGEMPFSQKNIWNYNSVSSILAFHSPLRFPCTDVITWMIIPFCTLWNLYWNLGYSYWKDLEPWFLTRCSIGWPSKTCFHSVLVLF